MEDLFKDAAGRMALGVEAAAVLLIAIGSIGAFARALWWLMPGRHGLGRREIFVRYAVWLMLGLEFELAADIIRSSISPTWTSIGQLGAIAAIRTVLNYFLEKDIAEFERPMAEA